MEIGTQISSSDLAAQREDAVLAVVTKLVQELHPQRAKADYVSRSSRLERDLGRDSLARTEFVLRIALGAASQTSQSS